jgi:hypothetical protein
VIRVHPREFPNRREGRKSQHACHLESALQGLPSNAVVNWPGENISIYDLIDKTDLFLNAWSTVGKDMAMLGLPVVIYSDKLPLYPAELNELGDTNESYFRSIDLALQEGWSIERARRAYRWAVFESIRSTIDISDSYFELEQHERPFLRKVVARVGHKLDPHFTQHSDILRRARRLNESARIEEFLAAGASTVVELQSPESVEQASLEEETEGLRRELKRLARALYATSEARSASRLYGALVDGTTVGSMSGARLV